MNEARKQVEAVVAEVAENFRDGLVRDYTDRVMRHLSFSVEHYGQEARVWINEYDYRRDEILDPYLLRDSKIDHPENSWRHGKVLRGYLLRPQTELLPILSKNAKAYAEMVLDDFRAKVSSKLLGIIDAKGNLSEAVAGGSMRRNTILFRFSDGSSFYVLNQIVHVWGQWNRAAFTRYPLTFHDVTLADGSRMRTPSEAKMKKTFALRPDGTGAIEVKATGPVVHFANRAENYVKWMGKVVGICVSSRIGGQKFYGTMTDDPAAVTCKKCLKNIEGR